MGERSKIEWTDHTFNPWVGCQSVSPGCDNCYAEVWAKRSGMVQWGPHAARRRTSEAYWQQPRKWNREAERTGIRPRVFAGSLCDWLDNRVPSEWRRDFLWLVRETPALRWQLLTKRIVNAANVLWDGWPDGFDHVGLMQTVCNQDEADRFVPELLLVPAAWHGLSMEPLLGPINLNLWLPRGHFFMGRCPDCDYVATSEQWGLINYSDDADTLCPICDSMAIEEANRLGWGVVGGESGPGARVMEADWARGAIRQCREAGVPVFVKQLGAAFSDPKNGIVGAALNVPQECAPQVTRRLKDRKGADMDEWPVDLRVREFPVAAP